MTIRSRSAIGVVEGVANLLARSPFYPYFLFFQAERRTNEELLRKYGTGRAIDIGCGSMNFRPFCLRETAIHSYWGIDYLAWTSNLTRGDPIAKRSPFLGILLRHRPTQPDIWGDGCRLALRGGCADTAISFGVLEHVANPGRFLAEVRRILREGGHFILTIPFLYQAHGGQEAQNDYLRWTKSGIISALASQGLHVLEVRPFGGVGTMFAQLVNSYIIKKLRIYDPKWFAAKALLLALLAPLFILTNSLGFMADTFDKDHAYACGFHVVAKR